jgi:hypothetical protein
VSEGRSQKLRPLRASEDGVEVSFGEVCERVSFARAVESYEVEQSCSFHDSADRVFQVPTENLTPPAKSSAD